MKTREENGQIVPIPEPRQRSIGPVQVYGSTTPEFDITFIDHPGGGVFSAKKEPNGSLTISYRRSWRARIISGLIGIVIGVCGKLLYDLFHQVSWADLLQIFW